MTTAMHQRKCCKGMSWWGSWARRVEGWGEEEEEGQVTLRGARGVVITRRKDQDVVIAAVCPSLAVGHGVWECEVGSGCA